MVKSKQFYENLKNLECSFFNHFNESGFIVSEVFEVGALCFLSPETVFRDSIRNQDREALIESLRSAHDSILYGSKVEVTEFRDVLFDLKQLGDWLEKI